MHNHKKLDLICLGRAAVDLYSEQIGSRLEDVSSFAKYLGGSSGNMAFGTARLGLKSAMLTRVGNEHMGRFVREELERAGVDTSHVITDPQRLTALVILGIKDQDTFPLIFYRNDCADMAVSKDDFDADFIGSAKALVISGTHFSTESTYETSKQAIAYAKQAGTKCALDIDYRPVLWGLTNPGDGETRFISNEKVSAHLQSILGDFDLIVGTEEEVHIAGGSTNTITALKKIRELSTATIVLKLGSQGCTVLEGDIPDSENDFELHTGVRVDVMNVLGAGDAFISGYLRGWIRNESPTKCCVYANACGALVVSRHGCAPAIPSAEELDNYIARAESIERPDLDQELNHLHRVTTERLPYDWQDLCILAFDHRKQLFDMAKQAGADLGRIKTLKRLMVEALEVGSKQLGSSQYGVLIDDTYGQDALNDVTGKGLWIGRPVELPSSRPIELEGGRSIGSRLKSWPKEHIVKCLVFYHSQDEVELRVAQERQVIELYKACCMSGHEFLLEIIPPRDKEHDDSVFTDTIQRFYHLNVRPDWWKLPPQSKSNWQAITDIVNKYDKHCRGVVMLGLDAPMEELKEGFANSAGFDICKGFAVGRSIFSGPSREWLANRYTDQQFIDGIVANYLELVAYWKQRYDHSSLSDSSQLAQEQA
ncbi:bifunctional 5-dehydro-2-deoxygluconokinase/5-dehydro-2-deoxyphosphogluconate aldolase [Marinomonas transparens]|uniref:5-dehydro-2-deoxygluconokinase n=1 Tax=Marinomonas transparens TaxID=2795388 RepID=A0A934JP31_9GAMM|nr:5-dehydro-2-deoxygluconokinase [Marinomonas transparens]MBJ7538033.1 5-dehydro-2-deoxygluconokinase [Marinomonas transparens]